MTRVSRSRVNEWPLGKHYVGLFSGDSVRLIDVLDKISLSSKWPLSLNPNQNFAQISEKKDTHFSALFYVKLCHITEFCKDRK